MAERKTIRNRGMTVEVVTRPARRRTRNTQTMFGGPESVMGGGVQRDMDAAVVGDLYASLDALKNPKGD
jgi:hypothetical protein